MHQVCKWCGTPRAATGGLCERRHQGGSADDARREAPRPPHFPQGRDPTRCRPDMPRLRQSRPDFGLGCNVSVVEIFSSFSLFARKTSRRFGRRCSTRSDETASFTSRFLLTAPLISGTPRVLKVTALSNPKPLIDLEASTRPLRFRTLRGSSYRNAGGGWRTLRRHAY